jgi:predicted TIM-barrel fold metal-dependent hydrolase
VPHRRPHPSAEHDADAPIPSFRHPHAPIENIVFGTDWPYSPLPKSGTDPQPALSILGKSRAKLDAENAQALVPRLYERVTG